MLIKAMPQQIPLFWDVIKYGVKHAEVLKQENYQPYFNELLHALLSDKAQCWVRMDENKVLLGVLITRVFGDKVTGEKAFHLQSAYSFKTVDQIIWKEDLNNLLNIARKKGCTKITFNTNNSRLEALATSLGFQEVSKSLEYAIGG